MIQRVPAGWKIVDCLEWTGEQPISRGNSRSDRALRMGMTNTTFQQDASNDGSFHIVSTTRPGDSQKDAFSSIFFKDPDSMWLDDTQESSHQQPRITFDQVRSAIATDIIKQYSDASPLYNRGYNPKTRLLCLDSRSRNCVMHGEHGHNRIYFVANLVKNIFYQKCFHDQSMAAESVAFSPATRDLISRYMQEQEDQIMSEKVATQIQQYLDFYDLLE